MFVECNVDSVDKPFSYRIKKNEYAKGPYLDVVTGNAVTRLIWSPTHQNAITFLSPFVKTQQLTKEKTKRVAEF